MSDKKDLRFAVFGAGFWTRFQLAAWREIGGAVPVAIYNRTIAKAEAYAREFNIPNVYDDPEALLVAEKSDLDFVDNITEIGGHKPLTLLCAKHGIATICQKPMAPSLADAEEMIQACSDAGIPFFIHENWRWQTPIRETKRILDSGVLGEVFRCRIDMISGFDVWANQPALAELENFILTDLGTHILDVARFYFGEAESVYCQTRNTLPGKIKGENVATVALRMNQGKTDVVCALAYAKTPLERERFPETFLFIEGSEGSLELGPDYIVRLTTKEGTSLRRVKPPRYFWADPAYDIVHASIAACNADLLSALKGESIAETTGEDNLKTIRLVYAAYESAATGNSVPC
jgi:hypothetical protein